MILHSLSLLLLLQNTAGVITGTVVDNATSQTVVGAQVLVVKLPTMGERGRSQTEAILRIPPQTTDTTGRFVFQNLPLGDYIVRVVADGYGDGSFVGRTSQSNGMPVSITGKEASRNVSFRLIGGSVISGRVVGVNGEPLGNLEVSLFQSRAEPDGQISYYQSMYTSTNDRGEYRLFPVNPGRYYLSAGPPTHAIPTVQASRPINNPKNKYSLVFYPGVPDTSAASMIDVLPGGALSDLDFRMSEQPTFRVKGRVIDTLTGQVPRNIGISITPRNSNLRVGGFSTAEVIDPRDGSFELQYVAPGSYIVRAQIPFSLQGSTPRPPGASDSAAAAVEVLNHDVDGVVLAFGPLRSVTGRVRMENGAPPPAGIRLNLFLRNVTPPLSNVPPRPLLNPDGSFRIDGIEPGEYRVLISVTRDNGGAANVSVREARSGSVNLLNEPLLLTEPRTDEIIVTLAPTSR